MPTHRKRNNAPAGPQKRRPPLPRLKTKPGRPRPPSPPAPGEVTPQAVTDIVESLDRVCSTTTLNPLIVLKDWLGMLEPALRFYPDNARAYVVTGQFLEDPPPVKAHFRRARERYLRASEAYPAAYRQMQEAFTLASALLRAAGDPGLAAYAPQTRVNPDLIGQVFLTVAQPDPSWWPYFPAWSEALAAAEAAIPDGQALVLEVLVKGHLAYREKAAGPILTPEPGPQFEQWYAEVLPYCQPLIIGPHQLDSSAAMLAAATRFPPWAVAAGLVHFYPQAAHPLLEQMAQINSYLYGLNGYELRLAEAALDILAARQLEVRSAPPEPEPAEDEPAASELASPDIVDDVLRQGVASADRLLPSVAGDQPTFAELFRKKGPANE